jgi:hypothetical protein
LQLRYCFLKRQAFRFHGAILNRGPAENLSRTLRTGHAAGAYAFPA